MSVCVSAALDLMVKPINLTKNTTEVKSMKCLPLVVVWGIENNKLANSKPHGPVKCCFPAEIILQKNL